MRWLPGAEPWPPGSSSTLAPRPGPQTNKQAMAFVMRSRLFRAIREHCFFSHRLLSPACLVPLLPGLALSRLK